MRSRIMTYSKVIKLIDKDNRLLILLGSMLADLILLISLVAYVTVIFAI